MQGKTYREYNQKYKKRVRAIYTIALLFVAFITVCFGVVLQSFAVSIALLFVGIFFVLLMSLLQKTDDLYISSVISSVSELIDALAELEKQEIFPVNEDSLISKLQSKIEKLAGTLRLQNEKERMEHENIKGLVSDISHQLKTPISNLRMYTEFLKNPELTKEEREQYVKILELSMERLTFLSESMIKVSRLESGLITLACKEQSINKTVLQAVKDVYTNARRAGIVIRYEEDCKCKIIHDRRWTAEACFNLLDNAVKYGKYGDEIILLLRELGTMLEISVKDCNTVIPQEERTRIFERFYRGKNAGKKEGVGIGLYLTREIIEKQGGYVSVREWEKGNNFAIVLPKK